MKRAGYIGIITGFLLISMALTQCGNLFSNEFEAYRTDERIRLRAHFTDIIRKLESRDVSALTESQQTLRKENIERLRRYSKRGLFPVNTEYPKQVLPYIRDARGTLCAMGYLMHHGGAPDLINSLAMNQNHIDLDDVSDGPVKVWLNKNGMSLYEAARIQPAYEHMRWRWLYAQNHSYAGGDHYGSSYFKSGLLGGNARIPRDMFRQIQYMEMVFLGVGNEIVALNLKTGESFWRRKMKGKLRGKLVVFRGRLYVGVGETLQVLRAVNGEILHKLPAPGGLVHAPILQMTKEHRPQLTYVSNKNFFAYYLNGLRKPLLKFKTALREKPLVPIFPYKGVERLLTVNGLQEYNQKGKLIKQIGFRPMQNSRVIQQNNQLVIATKESLKAFSLTPETKLRWTLPIKAGILQGPMMTHGMQLSVLDREGNIHRVPPESGESRGKSIKVSPGIQQISSPYIYKQANGREKYRNAVFTLKGNELIRTDTEAPGKQKSLLKTGSPQKGFLIAPGTNHRQGNRPAIAITTTEDGTITALQIRDGKGFWKTKLKKKITLSPIGTGGYPGLRFDIKKPQKPRPPQKR